MTAAPSFTRVSAARGECFLNAFFFVDQNPAWDVVHGIPLGRCPIEGVRYAHAWNEITHDGIRWVYEAYTDVLMPAALYYLIGAIKYTKIYTHRETMTHARKSAHAGPWDAKINQAEGR